MARKLLIVDDDTVLCGALARGFAARGFEPVTCGSPDELEATIATLVPDYAIVDLRLPGAEGLKIVSALKAANPRARIVVLTGYGSVPTAIDAIKRGATYYLAKPASIAQIEAAFDHTPGVERATSEEKPMSLARVEWEHIQRVLHDHHGNVSAAARALSMHRRTLQRKLAKRPVTR